MEGKRKNMPPTITQASLSWKTMLSFIPQQTQQFSLVFFFHSLEFERENEKREISEAGSGLIIEKSLILLHERNYFEIFFSWQLIFNNFFPSSYKHVLWASQQMAKQQCVMATIRSNYEWVSVFSKGIDAQKCILSRGAKIGREFCALHRIYCTIPLTRSKNKLPFSQILMANKNSVEFLFCTCKRVCAQGMFISSCFCTRQEYTGSHSFMDPSARTQETTKWWC